MVIVTPIWEWPSTSITTRAQETRLPIVHTEVLALGRASDHHGGMRNGRYRQMSGLGDLLNDWDFIGVYDPETNADEYDCMIGPLLSRLAAGATASDISRYLREELAGHFGMDPECTGPDEFAAKVVAWYAAQASLHVAPSRPRRG